MNNFDNVLCKFRIFFYKSSPFCKIKPKFKSLFIKAVSMSIQFQNIRVYCWTFAHHLQQMRPENKLFMFLFWSLHKGPFTLAIFAAILAAIFATISSVISNSRGIACSLHGRFEIATKSPRSRSKNRRLNRRKNRQCNKRALILQSMDEGDAH